MAGVRGGGDARDGDRDYDDEKDDGANISFALALPSSRQSPVSGEPGAGQT